jgi:hypothetical protein
MFNYQSLSGINKHLTLPNADQCHRFSFHYFDTYKIKGILFGALGYLEYPFLLGKVNFPQFFLFFQSSLAENQECLRWSTPFYSLWNIRARLVACEKSNQAWEAKRPLIEFLGCIQIVARTHVKASSTQALRIPLNRAYPQSHPRLWLP